LPKDRSVLRDLAKTGQGTPIGEGTKVRLVALVENAHYSDVSSGESVNCKKPSEETNDIHIPTVQTAGADECTSITAEISPHGRPAGWTPAALNKPGQVVRITGQLFFDGSHHPCTAGKPQNPKRASLWEIHPVYSIDVCSANSIADCAVDDDTKWHPLQAAPGETTSPHGASGSATTTGGSTPPAAVSRSAADGGKAEKGSGDETHGTGTDKPPADTSSKATCAKAGSASWALLAVLALLVVFLVLAAKSDMLRDVGTPPPAPGRQPFSLGRCQMAFWFFLIMGSFIWIAIACSSAPVLTPQVLGLMGIAAGTSLGAAAVDSGKDSQRRTAESAVQGVTTHIAQLDQQLAVVAPGTQGALNLAAQRADASVRHAAATRLQTALSPTAPPASHGFLVDILSDKNGVSFHRFQMLGWTIVLGIYFVVKVCSDFKMPDLDKSLLALMGISSGTYVGFKFPEQPKT